MIAEYGGSKEQRPMVFSAVKAVTNANAVRAANHAHANVAA
jgi:hypothetical protein